MKRDREWVLIGEVGVDAGLLTIGDPCYFSGFDYDRDVLPTVLGGYKKNQSHWELDQGMIVFSTTWGDGIYPVYAKFDSRGVPTEVKVVMDDEEYLSEDDDFCGECFSEDHTYEDCPVFAGE